MEKKLNDRQEKFCIEYIKNGGNASRAYRAAGYTQKHVDAGSYHLMKRPEIKERIKELLDSQRSADIADANEVMRYLTSVMRCGHKSKQLVILGAGDGFSEAHNVDKEPDEKERIEAAKTLAKIHGLYRDSPVNAGILVQILDDIPEPEPETDEDGESE